MLIALLLMTTSIFAMSIDMPKEALVNENFDVKVFKPMEKFKIQTESYCDMITDSGTYTGGFYVVTPDMVHYITDHVELVFNCHELGVADFKFYDEDEMYDFEMKIIEEQEEPEPEPEVHHGHGVSGLQMLTNRYNKQIALDILSNLNTLKDNEEFTHKIEVWTFKNGTTKVYFLGATTDTETVDGKIQHNKKILKELVYE